MSEIKTPLWKITEGHCLVIDTPYGRQSVFADDDTYIVTKAHSIADVVRYLVEASSENEVQQVLVRITQDRVKNDT